VTVFKIGLLGGVRMGSGVVVARLSDGSWSGPSALVLGGGGVGGQLGVELTDFVFILNDRAAVNTLASEGTFSLGGNVSVAAGPVGRNAEAAGAVSTKGVAAIFSYSKTQGFFAGVSVELSGLAPRNDLNAKMYQRPGITPSEILAGNVPPPPAAEPLMRILRSRAFGSMASGQSDMYNDVPVYDDRHDDIVWEGRRGSGYGEGMQRDRWSTPSDRAGARRSTWTDDNYDHQSGYSNSGSARAATFSHPGSGRRDGDGYGPADRQPGRPTAPKPVFKPKPGGASLGPNEARARFNFDADQPGDLAFRKGDIITIVKRTESQNDWWTGRIGSREGIFPRCVLFYWPFPVFISLP
jgi:lipid-binding SYLF domain-containing protein